MGNLSKWIEDKKTANINSDEYDITTNNLMREVFFNQIEDLDFDYEVIKDDSIYICLRLTYPNNEFKPFKFLLDTKKLIVTPQYTKTHRNLIVEYNTTEYEILKNLVTYIEDDYMRQKTKGFRRVSVNNTCNPNKQLISRVTGEYIRGGVDFIIEAPLLYNGTETVTIYYKNSDYKFEPLFVSKEILNEDIEFNSIPPHDIGVKHIYTKHDADTLEIIIFADIFNNESVDNFSAEITRNIK